MLTPDEYFGKFTPQFDPGEVVRANADFLLERVNALLDELPQIPAAVERIVNSGWRPASYNATVPNAAPNSRHITGQAIDIRDPDGELDEFLFNNPQFLSRFQLWMEHPLSSKGWTHLQSVPPRSGNRIFFP